MTFGMIALPNGKVLAFGGKASSGAMVQSSEIYDPGTGPGTDSWTPTTTSMSEPKYLPAPILLGGKVIVAGGNTGTTSTGTAQVEVFDIASQSWSTLTPLSQARDQSFAFALPNGRFALVGGRVPSPATGSMTPAGVNAAGAIEG